jgi:hypothetical protein
MTRLALFTRTCTWLLTVALLSACGSGGSVQPLDASTDPIPTDGVDTTNDVSTPDTSVDTSPGGCIPGSCPPGQSCVDGMCRTPCSGGTCSGSQTCCNGYCANTNTDPYHCGECNSPCWPEGNFCLSGSCSCNGAAACETGLLCCATGGCVDSQWDPDNCGDCGVSCADGEQCIGGVCGGSCAEHGCPDVDHGTATCDGDVCVIESCDEGWADADGDVSNGCECEAEADDHGGELCEVAYDLGSVSDEEPGGSVTVEGFVSASAPEDWYVFTATDTEDTECDAFHVDVHFDVNPEDSVVFDVTMGDCETLVCENDVEFEVATDFLDTSGPELTGECPCAADPGEGTNMCTDNTAVYYVVVKLAEGVTSMGCEPYQLTVSNGL